MPATFLICSYPRSRSLWLSHFFCFPPKVMCWHDPSEYAASSEEYWANLERGTPTVGAVDTAAILVLPAILAARPLTKVVWIERPLEHVASSMRQAGFNFTQEGASLLRAHKERYRSLFDFEIPFAELSHMGMIGALWQFFLPELAFDEDRWRHFEKTKIALTAKDYAQRPPGTAKFLHFLATEGETNLCSK